MRKIEKLFGDMVAVELVEEEVTGLIVAAPTAQKMHILGKVVAIGDKVKWVRPGETMLWQWNINLERSRYRINDKQTVFMLYERDLIARLASANVTLASFTIIGEWCLLRRTKDEKIGRILLPADAADQTAPSLMHYHLTAKGADTQDLAVDEGAEVIISRGLANPIEIDGQPYVYIQKQHIIGAYSES